MKTGPNQVFTYQHVGWTGSPVEIAIEPMEPGFLADRLNIGEVDAKELQERRLDAQESGLPNLMGEFVIRGMGGGGRRFQAADVAAISAHRQALGLGRQVYAGYSGDRGLIFLRQGLFPDMEEGSGLPAMQSGHWRQQVVFDKRNPFSDMASCGGEYADTPVTAPLVVAYDQARLRPAMIHRATIGAAKRRELLDLDRAGKHLPFPYMSVPAEEETRTRRAEVEADTVLWTSLDGTSTSDAVQAVYHRAED